MYQQSELSLTVPGLGSTSPLLISPSSPQLSTDPPSGVREILSTQAIGPDQTPASEQAPIPTLHTRSIHNRHAILALLLIVITERQALAEPPPTPSQPAPQVYELPAVQARFQKPIPAPPLEIRPHNASSAASSQRPASELGARSLFISPGRNHSNPATAIGQPGLLGDTAATRLRAGKGVTETGVQANPLDRNRPTSESAQQTQQAPILVIDRESDPAVQSPQFTSGPTPIASPPATPPTAPNVDLPAAPTAATTPAPTATTAASPAVGTAGSTAAVVSPTPDADAPQRITAGQIEERRKQLDSAELTEEIKAAAAVHYQQAADMLRRAEDIVKRANDLRTEKEAGPQNLAEIRDLLAKPAEAPNPQVAPDAGVSELKPLQLADEERLTEARKALDTWEQRAKVRTERKPQMPTLIEKTKQQLTEARKALEAPPPDGESPVVGQARRTEQEAYVILLQDQLDLYQVEKARYEALSELFPLQRDLLLRSRTTLEKRSEAWKTVLLEAGRRETELQSAEARRKLQSVHPALRELAERNTELIALRTQIQDLLADTRTRLNSINKTLEKLESDFSSVKDKEDRAGLTTAIGILLRNQRNHLPQDSVYIAHRRHAESKLSRLQLEQLAHEDERDELGDTMSRAQEIIADIGNVQTKNGQDIVEMADSLLRDRKQYLNDLLGDYDACIKELAELDVRSRKLVKTTGEYRNYIDERVLWIRSASFIGIDTPGQAWKGIADLADPDRWYQLGLAIANDVAQFPLLSSLCAFGLLFLLVIRIRLRSWIKKLEENARKRLVMGTVTTVAAIVLLLGIASLWPIVLWIVGQRIASGMSGEFGLAVGESLKTTAIVFWSIEVFRQICRTDGIAAKHLKWPQRSVRSLHAKLLTLMIAGLPLVYGVCLTERWQDGIWADSLGRMLFIAGMLLLAVSIKQILRPEGRVLGEVLAKYGDGWLNRARRIWYPLAVSVPLVLAGMAIAGYQYTAQQLLIRVELTFWLTIVLLIAFSLTMRWLMAARKSLAMEQARQAREAAAAVADSTPSQEEIGTAPRAEEPKLDFSILGDQMLKLLRASACVLFLTGGWFIWGEVLPALQVFNRVELWHTTVQIAEQVELAEGKSETRMVTKPQAITLGSLLLAGGFVLVSIVASRNIPGLLELSILQRLPLDHGGRNAITTMCRYVLTLSGVILAARTLGIGWSSVQWLIAALTVGLGFGLQEIFANFVSGLIILFERPVRIGDVVTIDGVSGTVSRIQIRATTITDFDRKEYIVPNKEFVTGRVLNWTLSDKLNRIVITVGVAYGSDTELARRLLVEAAGEHPIVLDEPVPVATFEGFGDSCLTLLLRCFLPGLENRLKTITELHEAIALKFKQNGLEIAFPQRDIHIRSLVSLPIADQLPVRVSETESNPYQPAETRKDAA